MVAALQAGSSQGFVRPHGGRGLSVEEVGGQYQKIYQHGQKDAERQSQSPIRFVVRVHAQSTCCKTRDTSTE